MIQTTDLNFWFNAPVTVTPYVEKRENNSTTIEKGTPFVVKAQIQQGSDSPNKSMNRGNRPLRSNILYFPRGTDIDYNSILSFDGNDNKVVSISTRKAYTRVVTGE